MQEEAIHLLRCPVSKSTLTLQRISYLTKNLNGVEQKLTKDAILFAEADWFYPVIDGIPRLIVEAVIDYELFFRKNLADYDARKATLMQKYGELINYARRKNKRTKQSFTQEWSIFNYSEDKTWNDDRDQMMNTFLTETNEQLANLKNKLVFDAGCGHGLLAQLVAQSGATVLAMDLSASIIRAYRENKEQNAYFIQGDVQFPPVKAETFHLIHCSGVLMFTNNTELSFSCLDECLKPGGKASIWLYHPQPSLINRLMNGIRSVTSRMPIRFQYYLYKVTILPVSYMIKRLKGNKQNAREMMIEILDTLSHRFRWVHEHAEAESWFLKRNYEEVRITTTNQFGFNIIGIKKKNIA